MTQTSIKILHLEDNPNDAELQDEFLRADGFEVASTRVDTREGMIDALDRGEFDLILADNRMPGFNGLAALAVAREKAPYIPFIFISGTLGEEVAIESLKNGATDYVIKQRLERLSPVVRRALDEAEEHRERQRAEASERDANLKLQRLNAELEQRVAARTAELKRALKIKDEFLANVSHELRTPLNSIIGLSESLSDEVIGSLNDKQKNYINTISESGRHLLDLINEVLDLAKIEAGQMRLNRSSVEIRAVAQASLRLINQLAQEKGQVIQLDLQGQLDFIHADERRLKQMLVNLLSNAVKFTPRGGTVGLEVSESQEDNVVKFTVWDTGIGIAEEDLTNLFRPFVQLESDLDRQAAGTGLGLALVAQMARLHGGSVSVESELGKGSRFSISLPWGSGLEADTTPRRKLAGRFRIVKARGENKKPTLLLVEDTEATILMLKDYLEYIGFQVEVARSGAEGIVIAQRIIPDLILMDVQMPDMDGLEATQKLRNDLQLKNTPIIAITALAMHGDRERCLAAGMDEYMSKPLNLKGLEKMIQGFLEERM
ncbi:MAG: response regulator [Chloroflexota bacterium]